MGKDALLGKKVFFDARYIRVGHHDGISRFSAGLFAALSKITPVVAIICDDRQLAHLPAKTEHVKLSDPTNGLAELFIARKLNALGADIVFSPMQTMGAWFRKYKLVLTLHDLIYYNHPTPPPSFSVAIRLGWRLFHLFYWPQRLILNQADAIVTVSETTKSLMLKHRLTKRPITVVHNAATGEPAALARKEHNRDLIYMGSYMDYKNVECLVFALQELSGFQLHLLSKIGDQRKTELVKLAGGAANRIHFHNGVSDDEYRSLLDNAFALVSASREEGFGIPVIEAMGRGTPAIVSDIEIFREVGGEAACYFNPDEPGELAARVHELENAEAWLKASSDALAQAGKFNWERSAEELYLLLKDLGS